MIEVCGITKKYGNFVAVNNVSLTAENGKITILLGPNGAGKSTTIKSIIGLLQCSGEILIDGINHREIEAKKAFGYIPETPVLYDELTVEEHIRFIGRAYRVEGYEEYAETLLKRFHLLEKKKTVVKELSKGMTQKLSFILALIIKPTSLMVDEPMVGLDPTAIEDVLKLLVELKEQGVSILISTHIIDIIDTIWDEAYIMNHGEIVRSVKREELNGESLKQLFFEVVKEEEE